MPTHKATKTKTQKVKRYKMQRKPHRRKGTHVKKSREFSVNTHYRKPAKKTRKTGGKRS